MRGPIVAGKGNFKEKQAQELWNAIGTILALKEIVKTLGPATMNAIDKQRYGPPVLIAPRLGQRSFRTLVTTGYSYRCAIRRERTLPVLQAAHIRPYADGGKLSNGLILRSDLHTLIRPALHHCGPNQAHARRQPTHSRTIRKRAGLLCVARPPRYHHPQTLWHYRPRTTWLLILRDSPSLKVTVTIVGKCIE